MFEDANQTACSIALIRGTTALRAARLIDQRFDEQVTRDDDRVRKRPAACHASVSY
jgi:hypothetical protein